MYKADLWCQSHVDGPCEVFSYIPACIQSHEHSDDLTAQPVRIEPVISDTCWLKESHHKQMIVGIDSAMWICPENLTRPRAYPSNLERPLMAMSLPSGSLYTEIYTLATARSLDTATSVTLAIADTASSSPSFTSGQTAPCRTYTAISRIFALLSQQNANLACHHLHCAQECTSAQSIAVCGAAYNAATHPVMEQEAPNLALYLLCDSCHPSWMRLLKREVTRHQCGGWGVACVCLKQILGCQVCSPYTGQHPLCTPACDARGGRLHGIAPFGTCVRSQPLSFAVHGLCSDERRMPSILAHHCSSEAAVDGAHNACA